MHPPESSIRNCPVSRRAALSLVTLSITSVTSAQAPPTELLAQQVLPAQAVANRPTIRGYQGYLIRSRALQVRHAGIRCVYSAIFGGPPRTAGGQPAQRLRFEVRYCRAVSGEAGSGLVQLTLSNQKVFGQEVWPRHCPARGVSPLEP